MEKYVAQTAGHLTIQPGDVIEVTGSTDCGLLEGYIRNTTQTGLFPSACVQKVQFRQKHISQVSIANTTQSQQVGESLEESLLEEQQLPSPPQQQQVPIAEMDHSKTFSDVGTPLLERDKSTVTTVDLLQHEIHTQMQYSSTTAPRSKKR